MVPGPCSVRYATVRRSSPVASNRRFHAVAAGLEPDTAPWDASWGERFFHMTDPDGHELSFARPPA